jgi:hypothetical protein
VLGLLFTKLALISNIARVERRLSFVKADALLNLLVYIRGIPFLHLRGIG